MNKQDISRIISCESEAIKAIGVEELHLFGSYAQDKATEKSDLDFAVKLVPEAKSILDFINVKFFLEDTFDCAIDLAPLENLHPALKSSISTSLIRVL